MSPAGVHCHSQSLLVIIEVLLKQLFLDTVNQGVSVYPNFVFIVFHFILQCFRREIVCVVF